MNKNNEYNRDVDRSKCHNSVCIFATVWTSKIQLGLIIFCNKNLVIAIYGIYESQ